MEAVTAELQRRAEETRKAKEAPHRLEQSTASVLGQSWDVLTASEQFPAETREAAQVPLPEAQHEEREYLEENAVDTQSNGHLAEPQAAEDPEFKPDPRSKAELWQAVKILSELNLAEMRPITD